MHKPIPATLIPGDGIGPSIVDAVLAVLDALGVNTRLGGLGMTPGANIGADAAIIEAVHGAAMMLEHCGLPEPAARIGNG